MFLFKIPPIEVHHTFDAPDLSFWPYVFAGLLVLLIVSVIASHRK